LKSQGVKKLANAVKSPLLPNLEEIDLCTNQISSGIIDFLKILLQDRSKSTFRSVLLNANNFKEGTLIEITNVVKQNKFEQSILGPLDENEDEEVEA